jgi:hypothetical protein
MIYLKFAIEYYDEALTFQPRRRRVGAATAIGAGMVT